MIEIQVSLALNLIDGFTGKPLRPAQAQLTLDGQRAQAIVKEGGWWVLCDLAPGEHQLEVRGAGFQPERITFEGGSGAQGMRLRLKPAPDYRFGRRVTTLTVQLTNKKGEPLPHRTLYALLPGRENELRLAQDEAKAGVKQLKLYASVPPGNLPIPGLFRMGEGAQAEMVRISSAQEDGCYRLTNPLGRDRRRGCTVRAVAAYTTDEQGRAFLALRQEESARLILVGAKGALREECVAVVALAHNEAVLEL